MGVPRLFPFITNCFSKQVRHFKRGSFSCKVDYLYLDSNGLLHTSAQKIFNYGSCKSHLKTRYSKLTYEEKVMEVYKDYFRKIVELTQIVVPREVLYIAIDGPAPLAKQNQQRQRRFVTSKEGCEFDSCSITPGTMFMHNLSRFLSFAIRNEMTKNPSWRDIKIYYSPPTVAGEGEHKLLDYIRSLSGDILNEKIHCMFGPDGDLIMLTLATHIPKILLFREDQYNPTFYHILYMGEIRNKLRYLFNHKSERSIDDIVNDFIFLGFFVGNDFLPKIQMFYRLEEGMDFMIKTYSRNTLQGRRDLLVRDGKLDIESISSFIESLAFSERKYLLSQGSVEPPEMKFINHTLIKNIVGVGEDLKFDYESYKMDYYAKSFIDYSGVRQMCIDYLKSLVWVYEYYVHGLPSWKWAYPWHYAPLMNDLKEVCSSLTSSEKDQIFAFDLQTPSMPFEQLLSVLPPSSNKLLPSKYRKIMTSKDSTLVKAGYYPEKFHIDFEGKVKEYQGVPILPFVDFDLVHKCYLNINGKNYSERNKKGKVNLFVKRVKIKEYNSEFGDILKCPITKRDIYGSS